MPEAPASLFLALLALSLPTPAQTTFFLSPGANPAGDLTFQAAAGPARFEEDFEGYPVSGSIVSSLLAGNVGIAVRLLDVADNPLAVRPTTFVSQIPGLFATPGVICHQTLLNGTTNINGQPLFHAPTIEFVFIRPVLAFGTWVFDDEPMLDSRFVLRITDATGQTFVSTPLDSGVGGVGGFEVDGFLGATSSLGIVSAAITVQDSLTGQVQTNRFFELDHTQIGQRFDVWMTQPSGAGTPVTLHDAGLVPGHEYFNLVSLDLCPGPPGSGPVAGLCVSTSLNLQFLMLQLQQPLGAGPLHFAATGSHVDWGPFSFGAATLELLCVDATGGGLQALSPVTRFTIQ